MNKRSDRNGFLLASALFSLIILLVSILLLAVCSSSLRKAAEPSVAETISQVFR